MIRAPLPRAISRCISARSASVPSPSMPRTSIRLAGAPIWLCGSSAMPCASRLRWSIRASMSSSARRSLASSAQRSRQRSTISVRFQSRTFGPKPFSSTARMVSMTWAWGLGMPSSPKSQCTLRSAIMPRSTNSRLSEVAGQFDALRLCHLARNGEFHFAGKLGVLADFERLDIVPEPFAVASTPPARSPAAAPRNGRRRAWRRNRGCDQAARRAAASPSGRRLTPPRWSQTCGQ